MLGRMHTSVKRPKIGVTKRKLSGHIISREGITIYPERVKVIARFPFLHNNKSMQYLFRKINFVTKFIPNFVEIIKPLQKIFRKDVDFKVEKEAFNKIKTVISQAPVLHNPNFSKNFFLYTFASDQYLAILLT
jgi:hypothetical protein